MLRSYKAKEKKMNSFTNLILKYFETLVYKKPTIAKLRCWELGS